MKKIRKYAEGGEPKFERSTYERARAMLLDQGPDRTPSLDARIARAKERIAAITQSTPASAPSRSAPRPVSRGDAETIDASSGSGMRRTAMEQAQEQEAADMGRAMQNAAVRSRIIPSAPTAVERDDADEGANLRRATSEEPKPSRSLQNVMSVRAQEQMERKGSIYSPDYGLSRVEREEKKAREKREQEEKKAREKREREAKVREKLERREAAIPPVPPPGTRAFADRRRRDLAGPAMMGEPEYKFGGMVGSASKRADGIAQKGKTKGRLY